MSFIPETVIDEVVDIIINTRDLCGNEGIAALEHAKELGLDKAAAFKVVRIATFRANARWNAFKKAAGVNPKHVF